MFLKRVPIPDIHLQDLYVGSRIVVYARQLIVKAYADSKTTNKFEKNNQRCLVLFHGANCFQTFSQFVEYACQKENGCSFLKIRSVELSSSQTKNLPSKLQLNQ